MRNGISKPQKLSILIYMKNKFISFFVSLLLTILISGFLILAPFIADDCGIFSMTSLCELNIIGFIAIALSSIAVLVYFSKAIWGTNGGTILKFMQIIGIVNVIQLSLAAPLNDTLHLWEANTEFQEIVLGGVAAVFFIFLPYISLVLLSLLSLRKQYSSITTPTMIPYITIVLVGALYYSMSRFSLNTMEFNLFWFAFDTKLFITMSLLLGLSMIVVRYIFLKSFFKPTHLLLFTVGGTIWYLYSIAIFNFLLYFIGEKYNLFNIPINYLSIIAIITFVFDLLIYQFLVTKITASNLQKNKFLIVSFASVALFLASQFALSFFKII